MFCPNFRVKIAKTMKAVILAVFLIVFLFPQAVSADTLQDKRNELNEIQKQINQQQESLNQKKKERQRLQNQVSIMDGQIRQTELSIQATQSEIDLTEAEIEKLKTQIKQKEKELAYQKEVLNETLRVIYEETDVSFLEILFSTNNISEVLNRTEYLGAIEGKISDTMDEMNRIKTALANDKKEQEGKKTELVKKKEELEAEKKIIVDQRATQANLLAQTRGQESAYQQQLASSQTRASSLQSFINAYNQDIGRGGGVASGDLVIRNDASYLFRQTDPRWSSYHYVPYNPPEYPCGDCTIGNYGCLITSLAMVAKYYGNSGINPILMANSLSFDKRGCLYWWPVIAGRGRQSVGWDGANQALSSGRLVIAHVYIRTTEYTGDHFVVISGKSGGNYIVQDPAFSAGKYYPHGWVDRMYAY